MMAARVAIFPVPGSWFPTDVNPASPTPVFFAGGEEGSGDVTHASAGHDAFGFFVGGEIPFLNHTARSVFVLGFGGKMRLGMTPSKVVAMDYLVSLSSFTSASEGALIW